MQVLLEVGLDWYQSIEKFMAFPTFLLLMLPILLLLLAAIVVILLLIKFYDLFYVQVWIFLVYKDVGDDGVR